MLVLPRLALALLLCLAVLAPSAQAARRSVPYGFYAVQYDRDVAFASAEVQEAQWARMAESGVEAVRTNFNWSEAQREESAPPNLSYTDLMVERATRHGIELLPIVIYAPRWARKYPDLGNSPPASHDGYLAYLRTLVARYGPEGSFWTDHPELPKRPLRKWQIWNEPQLRFQWNDSEYVAGYSALLKASYRTLKEVDRGSTVVMAGHTNVSWDVMEEFYEKGGIRGHFDVAAMHPYTAVGSRVVKIARLFRAVMREHGDARKPLWITEMGFPASKGKSSSDSTLQTTESGQAKQLKSAYTLLARTRKDPRVKVTRVFWYTWASQYSGDEIFNYSGLNAFDGTTFTSKPSLSAYRAMARRHQGCRKLATGRCR